MQIDIIPDIEVIEHLNFDHGLPCEGVWHPTGEQGHTGPAAYWQSGGCGHMEGLRCAGFVRQATTHYIRCVTCNAVYEPGIVTWRPISNAT